MSITFWYLAFILSSEKYYTLVMDRIESYAKPDATLSSENIFMVSDLLSDPLLQACFQETLRLRTQAGATRFVTEATSIPVGGRDYYLRKDSVVFIPAPLLHMDTDIYFNPTIFQPERFLGADIETALISLDGSTTTTAKDKQPPLKFFKNGVAVKHYMLPFGGGDSLVCTLRCVSDDSALADDLLKMKSSGWLPPYYIYLSLRIQREVRSRNLRSLLGGDLLLLLRDLRNPI
jgi:hypothetical protein